MHACQLSRSFKNLPVEFEIRFNPTPGPVARERAQLSGRTDAKNAGRR